jgi:LysW-gamma-L-alpha-aminoadipyl-6-phosphate/LysW-L-glutamyl-5-phosphate reductase
VARRGRPRSRVGRSLVPGALRISNRITLNSSNQSLKIALFVYFPELFELILRVGIIGASGYVGGELLRILLSHEQTEVTSATSKQYKDQPVHRVHPNLRSVSNLQFAEPNLDKLTKSCDFVFVAAPHGSAVKYVAPLLGAGIRVVDMSADHRLRDPSAYLHWYKMKHPNPELLHEAVFGIPELYQEEIKNAKLVANPGCMAITSILAIVPFAKGGVIDLDHIVVDAKIGSSGGGTKPTMGTHHAERYGVVRPYKPVDHRHTAEIEQEVSRFAGRQVKISMTPHAVNTVRGILVTIHCFVEKKLENPEAWKILRSFYQTAAFIRFVKDKKGLSRYPDPKILCGSNFCDIGFELDERLNRLLLLSATDNLVKGAAGNGVQCMNLMMGYDERTGLEFAGLHPI